MKFGIFCLILTLATSVSEEVKNFLELSCKVQWGLPGCKVVRICPPTFKKNA